MNAKTERTLAGLTVGVLLLIWFGIFLLVYYVPMLTAGQEQTGMELSSVQQLLVAASSFASGNILVVGLPLLAMTILATIWRVVTIWKAHKNAAAS
jgi:type II secretory pathway component PulF